VTGVILIIDNMIPDIAINFLKEGEGCASKFANRLVELTSFDKRDPMTIVYPYKCAAGKLTIGFGCRIYDDKGKLLLRTDCANGITFRECEELFIDLLENKYLPIIKRFSREKYNSFNENQIAALLSFCYNIEIGARRVLDLICRNESEENITNLWRKYHYIGTTPSDGLLRRREKEITLFYSKVDNVNVARSMLNKELEIRPSIPLQEEPSFKKAGVLAKFLFFLKTMIGFLILLYMT